MSRINDPELYDEALDAEANRQRTSLLGKLNAGHAVTLERIDMALGDFMDNSQAWLEVVRKTMAGENALKPVLDELVWAEAYNDARAALAGRADEAARERAESRAAERAWDRLIAMDHAYG